MWLLMLDKLSKSLEGLQEGVVGVYFYRYGESLSFSFFFNISIYIDDICKTACLADICIYYENIFDFAPSLQSVSYLNCLSEVQSGSSWYSYAVHAGGSMYLWSD